MASPAPRPLSLDGVGNPCLCWKHNAANRWVPSGTCSGRSAAGHSGPSHIQLVRPKGSVPCSVQNSGCRSRHLDPGRNAEGPGASGDVDSRPTTKIRERRDKTYMVSLLLFLLFWIILALDGISVQSVAVW